MEKNIEKNLIAPCGMNCGVCRAHLRDKSEKNYCSGCKSGAVYKYCQECIIRNCLERKGDFCDCDYLPCERLKHLDKRYRTKYDMSMIDNLDEIKENSIGFFIEKQNKKYISEKGTFCVHDKKYH